MISKTINVGTALLFLGCSSTTMVGRGDHFDLQQNSTLVTEDNLNLDIRRAYVKQDSLVASDYYTGREIHLPLSAVDKVVVKSRGRGALQGLRIGAMAGAGIGAVLGIAGGLNDLYSNVGVLSIMLGGYGMMIGPVVGAIKGKDQVFVFEPRTVPNLATDTAVLNPGKIAEDSTHFAKLDEHVKVVDSIKSNRKRGRWYTGYETGPWTGVLPRNRNSSISQGRKSSGWGGLLTSGSWSLGITMTPHLLMGTRFISVREGRYSEDYTAGLSYEINRNAMAAEMEGFYFPQIKGFFLKGALGYGFYDYEEKAGGPFAMDLTTVAKFSSQGVSGSGGLGYAFWLGKSLNLTLNAEALAAHYLDGASVLAARATVGLFWY